MSTSRVWPFIVIVLLFSAATVVTGESQTRPGVLLQIAPVLDDREGNLSSSSKEQPGDKSVSANLRVLTPPDREQLALLTVDPGFVQEVEPNGTAVTATPLGGTSVRVQANIFPNADVDFYSFTAATGDRVYAALMTSFSAASDTDSQLRVFSSDGTTVLEFDDNDGTLSETSSSIAGRTIPTAGTYYLEVRHSSAANQLRPYELHFRLQSGAPTPEVEGNNTPATANSLPDNGWVSGTRNPAAETEQDWYSFRVNAGDTVFLSLDLDPERNNEQWNGRLGLGLFGDATSQIITVDDNSTGSVANPLSESFFMTIKTAGTYYAFVDSAAVVGPTATYTLSMSIYPAVDAGVNCTTYTSTDIPKTIGPGTGLVSSTITIPGNPRIADMNVEIQLNGGLTGDVDAHLRSPAGNDNGLFTDLDTGLGGETQMDLIFDDEAGIPPNLFVFKGVQVKPEFDYRLSWFDGENAGGTWTLDLRDDGANTDDSTLTGWSIRICEPAPPPICPAETTQTTVFSTDFESGAAGFTHSGTQDEWELGLPTFAPLTTCNSGTNCWVTDLDGTYNISSSQDLLSPTINLSGLVAPVIVTWAQRYQMEEASFDHYSVDIQQADGSNPTRLFEWHDATMVDIVGNPTVMLQASAGWGVFSARADAYAGQNTKLRFHLDSDSIIQLAGAAIDDVSVTACRQISADLFITKTDGVTTAVPGQLLTYTIVASNADPNGVTNATVTDTFPTECTNVTWTCVGAGGGTCTAAGSGDLNDSVTLPNGGSITYTAMCTIASDATGNLTNTATVSAPGGETDPVPGNNSATDTDTLIPAADLSITKTDGVTSATAGGTVTYSIVASNAGPNAATGATVADTFPVACESVSWTCLGAGGGTCTASGTGNINDTVGLPDGASVTYTATCTISASATGTLVNTATVTAPGGVGDPTPGDNSATDTDTLAPCFLLATLTPPNQVMIAGGGAANVNVTVPTGCAWTAGSNVPWVTITGGSPGNGSGTAQYTVTANPGPNPRRGTLAIAGKTFIVSQNTPVPAPCTISVSPPGSPIDASGGTGSVTITASTGSCGWWAQSRVPWITLTSAVSGSGSGTVQFSVAANPGGPRAGRITVNGKRVTITQN